MHDASRGAGLDRHLNLTLVGNTHSEQRYQHLYASATESATGQYRCHGQHCCYLHFDECYGGNTARKVLAQLISSRVYFVSIMSMLAPAAG